MDLIELSKYLLDEKAAEEYLIEKGVIKTFGKCIRCESEKLGKIRRGKIKCYDCKYEWKQTKGSILEECRISASKFLGLLKLFELEVPAYKAAKILRIKPTKAYNYYNIIRRKINNSEIVSNKLTELLFQIKLFEEKIFVFPYDENLENKIILQIQRRRGENKVIELTVKYLDQRNFIKPTKYLRDNETLLNFVKELRIKLIGLRNQYYQDIYLFIKEVEFRFNNRNKEIFLELLSKFKQ